MILLSIGSLAWGLKTICTVGVFAAYAGDEMVTDGADAYGGSLAERFSDYFDGDTSVVPVVAGIELSEPVLVLGLHPE